MNDLEWLARNQENWPYLKSEHAEVVRDSENNPFGVRSAAIGIPREAWQAERARLQNKPSYHVWRFIAQDESGEWWGYSYEPKILAHGWDKTGHCVRLSKGEVLGMWHHTLEPRPEEQTIAVKEWRGPEDGLPPVGIEVEYRCKDRELLWKTVKVCSYVEDNYFVVLRRRTLWPMIERTDQCEFRPLRTEEDMAVDDMAELMHKSGEHAWSELAQVLYNPGYRKQDATE